MMDVVVNKIVNMYQSVVARVPDCDMMCVIGGFSHSQLLFQTLLEVSHQRELAVRKRLEDAVAATAAASVDDDNKKKKIVLVNGAPSKYVLGRCHWGIILCNGYSCDLKSDCKAHIWLQFCATMGRRK
jgi:hypothetical protein